MIYKKHEIGAPVVVEPFGGQDWIVEFAIVSGFHYYVMTEGVVTHGMIEISEAEARSLSGFVRPEFQHLVPFAQVPQEISRRQFFRALDQMNISEEEVQSVIDLAPRTVQIDYRDFTSAYRNDPSLLYMMQALGRTEDDLDNLFIIGSQL